MSSLSVLRLPRDGRACLRLAFIEGGVVIMGINRFCGEIVIFVVMRKFVCTRLKKINQIEKTVTALEHFKQTVYFQ